MPYVDVYIDLDSFTDDDLIDELKDRRLNLHEFSFEEEKELIERIWLKRRVGEDYQKELDELIYLVMGKIV
jgi:hypothetical protein